MDAPSGIYVDDISNITEPMIKKFKVDITNIGTDSCLLINYAESTTVESLPPPGPDDEPNVVAYGGEESCKEIFPDADYRLINLIN